MFRRWLRSSIQDKKMFALDILQANMESQPRNRSNVFIRAANVDSFRQMHICRHIWKEAFVLKVSTPLSILSRSQLSCVSSNRAHRSSTTWKRKQVVSIHVHLQRATTKHHRKPFFLNPRTACWTQVDQIGIGWIWELSFRPCSFFSLSPFLPDK